MQDSSTSTRVKVLKQTSDLFGKKKKMKRHTLEQLVKTASEVYKIPTLSACSIDFNNERKLAVETQWTQLDLERNEQTKFSKRYLFEVNKDNAGGLSLLDTSKPTLLRSDNWSVKSRNGLLQAVISTWKDKTEEKQFLEIWNNESKVSNVNLAKVDKHGKLYDSSLVWSAESTKLAYVAEVKKTRKIASFFTADEGTVDETNHEEKYANDYVDDWGEQNIGKSQSVIAVVDVKTLELKVLENLPKDLCPMNLTWYKNEGIVFSALYSKPYKLGLVYCPIRKSELFYYDLNEATCVQLTSDNENVRDPRFSNDFASLCWLQNPADGPHFRCSQLKLMNWSTRRTETLVDLVREESANGAFNGIFTQSLLSQCWSLDNKRILLSTQASHKMRVLSCDVETKSVTVLDNGLNDLTYCECLTFNNDWICALSQSYNRKPKLIVAKLPDRSNEKQIKWNHSEDSQDDELELSVQVDLLKFEPSYKNLKFPNVKFEAILVRPKSQTENLVVFPHGGPHSAFACEYSHHITILNQLGYAVLLVNYRGSSGYGQDSIDSLPGDIGTQDVRDMQQAAEYCMQKLSFKKAVLYGGSHGGFLSTHLVGQYPEFYKAAVVRNPVTQLEAMRHLSDIPDWVMTEVFGTYEFDFKTTGSREKYEELLKKSPIRYIDSVKTPVLFLTGSVDVRVPATQSMEYYKGLLARGVPTRLIQYKEDNHPLAKPQTTADCIVNAVLWYEKYLP